jgi:hypothetical protein
MWFFPVQRNFERAFEIRKLNFFGSSVGLLSQQARLILPKCRAAAFAKTPDTWLSGSPDLSRERTHSGARRTPGLSCALAAGASNAALKSGASTATQPFTDSSQCSTGVELGPKTWP